MSNICPEIVLRAQVTSCRLPRGGHAKGQIRREAVTQNHGTRNGLAGLPRSADATRIGAPMFERFQQRARHVLVLAQEEARTLKHNYIGTEHILLGPPISRRPGMTRHG